MKELVNSGLPLYIDEKKHIMAISAVLKYDEYGRKKTGEMLGLLKNENGLDLEEEFYDVYRGIAYPKDEKLLSKNDFRYDITIIMPKQVNGECKKTSGHYHGWNKMKTNTYAEVYEVIKGTALYILQKSNNFDTKNPEEMRVDDLIFVTVHEGETIIIPPNYGHASVNIGESVLIFSNLAYVPCPVHYGPVRHFHGMSYYIMKEGNDIKLELNNRYVDVPEPKYAGVKENPDLGIKFEIPVYRSYKENPDAFKFLANPDPYVEEIMGMLVYNNELIK